MRRISILTFKGGTGKTSSHCLAGTNPLSKLAWLVRALVVMTSLITLAFISTGTANAVSIYQPTPKIVGRAFPNCQAAVNYLSSTAEPSSAYDAFIPVTGPITRSAAGYSEAVHWEVNRGQSYTVIVRPYWGNMTSAESTAVNKYVNAVRVHEEGHHVVAQTFMAGAGKTITANSRASLRQALLKYRQDTLRDLDAKRIEYDTLTDHGRKQSTYSAYPGKDVILSCPTPQPPAGGQSPSGNGPYACKYGGTYKTLPLCESNCANKRPFGDFSTNLCKPANTMK